MRSRALAAVLPAAVIQMALSSCIVAQDSPVLVDLEADYLTQKNFRGMVQNETGVAQGSMAVDLPLVDQGDLVLASEASMDLSNDPGDAWFPEGHGGEVTEADLSARYSNEWAGFDWTLGIVNYNLMNGAEFAQATALGARGPTTELFVAVSRAWFIEPALAVHYDIDEVEDVYVRGSLGKVFPIGEKWALGAEVGLGWSGEDMSLWNYGLAESGFADLGASVELAWSLSETTSLRALVAGSTIVDSSLQDWFDLIGIETDNVWAGLGATWSF
jgi:hypothetical protein